MLVSVCSCVCVCVRPPVHASVFVFFLYHDVATAGGVSSVAKRANFGMSLVFKVQFLVLNAHIASPWWTGKEQTEKEEGKAEERKKSLCTWSTGVFYQFQSFKNMLLHIFKQQEITKLFKVIANKEQNVIK